MGKIRTKSLRRSMTATFLITICGIALLSAVTILGTSRLQQEILNRRRLTISSSGFQIETGYILDIGSNSIRWQPLSERDRIAYYALYAAMIALPVLYLVLGIGSATAVYYRRRLRIPIAQLQKGVEKIQEDDLDFHMEYEGSDELGQLCCSMEKMRRELRQKHKALWEALEQRKLLNASVAHDLRTPITVLKGYLDYLEKSAAKGRLTQEMLFDTISSMQGAAVRLERYVECVRDIEQIESIEIEKRPENVGLLLSEIRSNVLQLKNEMRNNAQQASEIEILVSDNILPEEIQIDKTAFFRILENLLQNAVRYARNRVNIDISQRGDFLILSVRDDGKGFVEAAPEKAVTVFYSTDKGEQHFGIGLSVCRLLCEKHGGRLYLENGKDVGACVTASLKII